MRAAAAILLLLAVGCAAAARVAAPALDDLDARGDKSLSRRASAMQQAIQQQQQQQQQQQRVPGAAPQQQPAVQQQPPQKAVAEAVDALGARGDSDVYESLAFGDIIEGAAVAAAAAATPNDAQRPMHVGASAAQHAVAANRPRRPHSMKEKEGSSSISKPKSKPKSAAGTQHAKAAPEAAVEADQGDGQGMPSCPVWPANAKGQALTAAGRPAAKLHVFSELTVDEYNAVLSFLYDEKKLGLEDIVSMDPNRTVTVANYIHSIHMEMPTKEEVLAHLDHKGPLPVRKARAALVLGKADPPHVREVLVTLQDAGDSVAVLNMERVNVQSSEVARVAYAMRPQGPLDENGANQAINAVTTKLNKLLSAAFEGYTYGEECGDKCIDWSLTFSQAMGDKYLRGSYLQFYWFTSEEGDGNYLHALPLQMLIASEDANLEDWSIVQIWFAGTRFDTLEELLSAWKHDTDGLRSSFTFIFPEGDDGRYDSFRKRPSDNLRAEAQPVGPIAYEPYGKRFKITKGNRVSWLGWSLYVGYLPNHGPRFWDVRFKKERIAYELSMQEAMAVYGSGDLSQANTVFLDSSFGIGYNLRELAQGIDCPMHAVFMDADIFYGGMSGPTTYRNAICVFEHNPELPALRHYSSAYKFYGAIPGAQLIVRMISTVYNYDYIQDLILGLDGMIDVRVITSGYVQATTYQPGYRSHYGYPLMHNVSGTVHTHVLAWKVDLDIAGTANSINVLNFESADGSNGLGAATLMNRYEAKMPSTEEESGFIASILEPKIPLVINEAKKNKWGSPRGYKVQLNRPLANLEKAGYPRSAGLGFWKWNFVATQRQEHESHSSSMYNLGDMARPVTSLTNYVGDDPIRNTDVVVWVNSGLYHVPMAEDAPVTPSSGGNALGFSLAPYNWANESPATDMANMIMIDGNSLSLRNITEPAVKQVVDKCAPTFTKLPFSTSGFEGTTHTDDKVASDAAKNARGGRKIRNKDDDDREDDEEEEEEKGKEAGTEEAQAEEEAEEGEERGEEEGVEVRTAATAGAKAQAKARPAQARSCRERGKWVAC